ncbi:MAG: protein kinase, partial [Bdellovibrionales bacterium]|nr:protein kinase [Bdellovibrionales bacterium]
EGLDLGELSQELCQEIIAQAQLGLQAIHDQGLVHGDLNLKNIFITQEGTIRLLDFGFLQNQDYLYASPQFLDPEVLQGKAMSPASDWFALGMIERYLAGSYRGSTPGGEGLNQNSLLAFPADQRAPLALSTHAHRRRKLGEWVQKAMKQQKFSTQILFVPKARHPWMFKIGLAFAAFLLSFFALATGGGAESGSLSIRYQQWAQVSINGVEQGYTPMNLKGLRPGRYHVSWQGPAGAGSRWITIKNGETFLLKP